MPPPNLILAKLPTEINDSAVMFIGEIAEAQVDIFNHHAKLVNRLQIAADFMQGLNVSCPDRAAATERGVRARLLDLILRVRDDGFGSTDGCKSLIQLGEKFIRLGQCEYAIGCVVI